MVVRPDGRTGKTSMVTDYPAGTVMVFELNFSAAA